jgi:dihydropteroate synthase
MIWRLRSRSLDLTHRGLIMGVLNVTPDSFSDGGRYYDAAAAAARGLEMVAEGADILDIGGESTRPGAEPVPAEEEMRRVIPVIEALRRAGCTCPLSIDTMKAATARAAVEAGAEIINDISGLHFDPGMAAAAAETGAGLVLMHMQGTPQTMQAQPVYTDVVADICASLARSMAVAQQAGVALECIVTDPGIGFGKTLEHNLAILRQPEAFALEGRPVLYGVSRKSFIARILGPSPPAERLWPTVALTAALREKGVRLFRVHDVRENAQALRMAEAIAGVQ